MRGRHSGILLAAACGAALGCVATPVRSPPRQSTVMVVSAHCAGTSSCVLGHVTTIQSAAPVAEAAVFLVRELENDEQEPVRFFALTDEQGVFVVDDPPPGSYRVSVYKDDSSVEVTGMQLGEAGTTLLPVRLGLQ